MKYERQIQEILAHRNPKKVQEFLKKMTAKMSQEERQEAEGKKDDKKKL